jgi:hypothetical protein
MKVFEITQTGTRTLAVAVPDDMTEEQFANLADQLIEESNMVAWDFDHTEFEEITDYPPQIFIDSYGEEIDLEELEEINASLIEAA